MKRIFTIIFSALFISGISQAQSSGSTTSFLKTIFNNYEKQKEVVSMTLRDGSVYTGEIKRKRPHGNGTVQYANGDVYSGTFLDGSRHGSGVYEYKNGDRYKGDYKEDKRQGSGIYEYADGRKYDGSWVDDHIQGYGRLDYPNGDYYVGAWVLGKPTQTSFSTSAPPLSLP